MVHIRESLRQLLDECCDAGLIERYDVDAKSIILIKGQWRGGMLRAHQLEQFESGRS